MSATNNLTAADVSKGDTLPPLSVDVSATTIVLGALASRDYRPMHHDKDFAVNQGVSNIFLNTPNQAAWFERYLTDWTGALGRVGRLKFKMRDSVVPGDTMVFNATVENIENDETGCCWVDLDVDLTVRGNAVTSCGARVAIPASEGDNPWKRKNENWKP